MTVASNSLNEDESDARDEDFREHAWPWLVGRPTGNCTYVSSKALAYLGQAREDLDPMDDDEFGWRRVIHPDDYGRVAAKWRHCLRTGDRMTPNIGCEALTAYSAGLEIREERRAMATDAPSGTAQQ